MANEHIDLMMLESGTTFQIKNTRWKLKIQRKNQEKVHCTISLAISGNSSHTIFTYHSNGREQNDLNRRNERLQTAEFDMNNLFKLGFSSTGGR